MVQMSISSDLINRPTTGLGRVLRLYHSRLKRLWIGATQAFIFAAIERIPIDTGMSRAAFLPLAANVRFKTVMRSLLVGNKGPRFSYDYAPGTAKSIPHGEDLGRDAYKLNFGAPRNPSMSFEFRVVVFQHRIHEVIALDGPPWKAMDAGKAAFLAFWETNFEGFIQLPDLLRRIVRGS